MLTNVPHSYKLLIIRGKCGVREMAYIETVFSAQFFVNLEFLLTIKSSVFFNLNIIHIPDFVDVSPIFQ